MTSKKKIALILVKGKAHSFDYLQEDRPDSLTINYMYSTIKSNFPDIEVNIYDETIENIKKEEIDADIIGISAITSSINRAYKYADYFREKGIPVFIEGIHATLLPEEASQHADSVMIGLTNETLPEMINDFYNGHLKKTYKQSADMSFSNWVFPDKNVYYEQKNVKKPNKRIYASWGCPNNCEFCFQPLIYQGQHYRPIDDVIEEVKQMGTKRIFFNDPNLSRDEEYLVELCKRMIPLKKKWTAVMQITIADNEELLSLLKESGCHILFIGFESVNQNSLKSINKGFNQTEKYIEAVKRIHGKGIMIIGSFIFGFDDDDKTVFKRTVDFINDAKIDIPRFNICTPYPGTRFYERMKAENRITETNWTLYDRCHCVFQPKNMTVKELEKGYKWSIKKSYSILSILKRSLYEKSFKKCLVLAITNYIMGKYAFKTYFAKKDNLLANDEI